ncbi:hypothetical protein H5410_055459 [Solanum commersonii]|uniref:Uncharacterized protein n=1 Tax=Solanum commersonii TaxID=4109 RepID=A0A9J5WIS2_SOLCO|nr:hypothetical protein H5410_055459 [Solanum commersonii]
MHEHGSCLMYQGLRIFSCSSTCYNLGICQCICHILCRTTWACFSTCFSALDCCCTCICFNIQKLLLTPRHNRRRRRHLKDIEEALVVSIKGIYALVFER